MKKRILTAIIGVPFLAFVLYVRGWFGELLVVLFTMLALWEYYGALRKSGYRVCTWGGYAGAILMWPLSRAMGVLDPLLLLMAVMGISFTGVLLGKEPRFEDAIASVYPLFTCLLPFSMFMMLFNATYCQIEGITLVTLAFAIAFGCDGAAYFGGRALGKHKLCPTVSPKKTVEGAIFGLIGGTLCGLACRFVFLRVFHMATPGLLATIIIGLLGSAAGQIGDLAASLLKRHSGIKDYGHLLPGHGGVMDRFDSVIFTLIVVYFYTLFV